MRNGVIVLLCTILLASTAGGQTESTVQPVSLAEQHTIYLSLGMKTNSRTTVSVSPGTVHVESGGVGLIGYGYWFDEQWQLNFSAGVFGVQSNVDVGSTSNRVFNPVLFGISYYPAALKMGKSGRPYIGVSGGPYTGILSRTGTVVGAETVTETVVGGRFVLGVDIFLGSWFRIGPLIGYRFVGEFQEVVGEKTDFSGAEFALVLGVVL